MRLDAPLVALGLGAVLGLLRWVRSARFKRALAARMRASGREVDLSAVPPFADPLVRHLWKGRARFSTEVTGNLQDPELRSLVEDYRRHERIHRVAEWLVAAAILLSTFLWALR